MLRRYELTDEEWLRIEPLLPPENTGKQGRPRKDNRILWRFFYGGECEDPESGENGSDAGYDSRLSNGTYGICGDNREDSFRV